MIYLVTGQKALFESENYTILDYDKALEILKECDKLQVDTETDGKDAHINKILTIQFGNKEKDFQIVIDAATNNLSKLKEILETKFLIFQNAKFDLQFLYSLGIIPQRIYDTMIVEQLLYLGYPQGIIHYSLKSIAYRRLNIDIDKSVRGEIIWRGLDDTVVKYAAGDVMYLEDIMESQWKDVIRQGLTKAVEVECKFIPSLAYLEWCGIHLDAEKWKAKMENDKKSLKESKVSLDNYVCKNEKLKKFTFIDRQGDLFTGFDLTPKCLINWDSPKQTTQVFSALGFNTKVEDKKTGESKDSVLEKVLANQKGIDDEFLKIYFNYREYSKVCSTYGQSHLDSINPITGRLHTVFRQLGAASGRLSCGSNQSNEDLAKLKKIPSKGCTYHNLQQLPNNKETRSCFTAPDGYMFVSCDYSAEESRLGADIYQDKEFLREFKEGSGDTHNMFAWIVYNKECRELGCQDATEVKKKAPQWRKKVKGFELSYPDSLR